MPDPITTAKRQLVDELTEAGVDALAFVPEEWPGAVVAILDGAEEYLTEGETFSPTDDVWLSATLYVLVELTGNQQAIEDLDAALAKVLPALKASPSWHYQPVGKPGPFSTANWLAHGVAIPVSTLINLTQE